MEPNPCNGLFSNGKLQHKRYLKFSYFLNLITFASLNA